MEKRVKLWTLCLSVQNLQTICLERNTKQWLGHIPVWKEKSFYRVSYWPLMRHWHLSRLYITFLDKSRWALWSALLQVHWNATFLWAWPILLHLGSVCFAGKSSMALNLWKVCDLFPSMNVSRLWSVGVCGKTCRLCCSQQRDTSTVGQRLSSFSIAVKLFVTRLDQRMQQLFENSVSVDHPALGHSMCRKNIKSRIRGKVSFIILLLGPYSCP